MTMDTTLAEAHTRLAARLSAEARIIRADTQGYDQARTQFASHLGDTAQADHRLSPSLIVHPATEADLTQTIRFACARGYVIAARSGGHQYSGLSSCPRDLGPSIQVDLACFNEVALPQVAEANRVDPGRPEMETCRVVLGAGARLRNVYRILARYHLVLPGGVCLDVGVGGHLQSSAVGLLGRSFGLGLDRVRRIRIALAETGRIIDATAEHHPELFWAVLGGSPGSFGVVIEFEVELFNARCFPHAYGVRYTWDFSEPLLRQHLETLHRIMALPAYEQRRDATIYLSVNRSLYHPYLAGGPDEPARQHITLMLVWTGIDSGSIRTPVPTELLGDLAEGTTFHDALIAPFLEAAPPLGDAITHELDYQQDSECDLAHMAATLVAPNIVGSLDENWREIVPLLTETAEEEHSRTHEVRSSAESAGVDWQKETARYIPVARFSYEPLPKSFVETCINQLRRMRGNPHIGCVLQMLPMGGELNKDSGRTSFPQFRVQWGYDVWVLWRGTLGAEVGEAAQSWIEETDAAFSKHMGERTGKLLYCTSGKLDIRDPDIRRLYYPDDGHFQKLQRIKGRYDPKDRFHSRFSIPPMAGEEVAPSYTGPPRPTPLPIRIPARARFRSLTDRILENMGTNPDKPYLTWIDDNGTFRPPITYGQVREETIARARWMKQRLGLLPGDRALICFPPGPEFLYTYLACQLVGAIPIAVYLFDATQDDRYRQAFLHIHTDSRPRFVLTNRAFDLHRRLTRRGRRALAGIPWVVVRRLAGDSFVPFEAARDDVALIQYTSGSTGPARGVALTHSNLLRQFLLTHDALETDEDSTGLVWMPQAHDFGLISTMFTGLVTNTSLAMMSPAAFVKRPALWFEAMHRFRPTHTAAPNFAYAIALARTTAEERAGWDLSSVRLLMSAAEPIEPETMEAFFLAFEPARLSREAFRPAYGLLEYSVGATMGGGRIARVDREALSRGQVVLSEEGEALWSSGRIGAHLVVAIVSGGQAQEDGRVGEIWLDGPCRSPGYLAPDGGIQSEIARLPGSSRGWIQSGDLGFVLDGELFALCRLADVVRVDGRWIYPPLIERHLGTRLDWARPGSAVAYQTPAGGLGVLVELDHRRASSAEPRQLLAELAGALAGHRGRLGQLVIARRGFVLKTTSGKRRRRATARRLYDPGAQGLILAREEPGVL